MNRGLLKLIGIGALVAITTAGYSADEQPWEIKLAGDLFFADYKTEFEGGFEVEADGTLPGGVLTVRKGTVGADLLIRTGTLDVNTPAGSPVELDRLDVDFRFSFWPETEALAKKGIHWFGNLGYRHYNVDWNVPTLSETPHKRVNAFYLGLGAFWTVTKPTDRFQVVLKGEINGLLGFADVSESLQDFFDFDDETDDLAAGFSTRGGLVLDFRLFSADSWSSSLFADGGWQYELIAFSAATGRDEFFGPYARAGLRFFF